VPAVVLTAFDLAPFATIEDEKAEAMIADALARAARVAPCISEAAFAYPEAAKAVLRGAILRWNEAGTGVLTQQSAGTFSQSVDTRQARRSMFWPSEIVELQKLCGTARARAFTVNTAPVGSGVVSDSEFFAPPTDPPLLI